MQSILCWSCYEDAPYVAPNPTTAAVATGGSGVVRTAARCFFWERSKKDWKRETSFLFLSFPPAAAGVFLKMATPADFLTRCVQTASCMPCSRLPLLSKPAHRRLAQVWHNNFLLLHSAIPLTSNFILFLVSSFFFFPLLYNTCPRHRTHAAPMGGGWSRCGRSAWCIRRLSFGHGKDTTTESNGKSEMHTPYIG